MSDNRLQTFLDERAAEEARCFVDWFNDKRRACESPIEEMLLCALLAEHRAYTDSLFPNWAIQFYFHLPKGEMRRWHDRMCPIGTTIFPQAPIGEYRADFLFAFAPEWRDPPKRLMVVECDGHAYHERTKAQARRDRARDRWMVGKGITVLRFTGSEIWADPSACALECLETWQRIIHERRHGQNCESDICLAEIIA